MFWFTATRQVLPGANAWVQGPSRLRSKSITEETVAFPEGSASSSREHPRFSRRLAK